MPRATSTKSTTKSTTKKTPAKRTPAKPKGPTVEERLARLEEKLQTLCIVLHHNYAKDLVKGPKDLARKIAKNGLLE